MNPVGMMRSFSAITDEQIRGIARQAVAEFLDSGDGSGDLTDCVVKSASLTDYAFTPEHVRRVCEETYKQTFERMFEKAAGADRFVSYDPPDPAAVTSRLKTVMAAKTAAAALPPDRPESFGLGQDKTASAPDTRYRPGNAYDAMLEHYDRTREVEKVADAVPLGEVYRLRQDVFDAQQTLKGRLGGLESAQDSVMHSLAKTAMQVYRNGTSMGQILYACVRASEMGAAEVPQQFIQTASSKLASAMLQQGCTVQEVKVASFPDPNLEHPLTRQFLKLADVMYELAKTRKALDDITDQRRRLDGGIHDLLRA